jgi:hypothetical protein
MASSFDANTTPLSLNKQLVGTWLSGSCEMGTMSVGVLGTPYYKRQYKFTETDWQVTIDIFSDANCALKLATSDAKGSYSIGNMVFSPAGATEINFNYSERGMTAYVAQMTTILNSVACGGITNWMVGTRVNVSNAGCAGFLPSNASCPTELDLVKLTDTNLFLGQRPMTVNGLCSARATTLSTVALIKQ